MSSHITPEKDDIDAESVFSWTAPQRPFKKRDKTYFQTAGALAFLLIVIAFFVKEWLLAGAILSVVFISYVLAAVPPREEKNKITNHGIWIAGTFYKHPKILEYWFDNKLETDLLHFVVDGKQPKRVSVVIPKHLKKDIHEYLKKHIAFRQKPLKTITDKVAEWFVKKVPLEEQA